MAVFETDFSEYPSDLQPADWTKNFGTFTLEVKDVAGALGGKVLRLSGGAAGAFHIATWDDASAETTPVWPEILTKFRAPSGSANFAVRWKIGAVEGDAYNINFTPTTTVEARQGSTVLDNQTGLTLPAAPDWTWIRARHLPTGSPSGDRHLWIKWWNDGESEPAGWNYQSGATIDEFATYVGMGLGAWNASQTLEWDYYAVATNGETLEVPTASAGPTHPFTSVTIS